MSCRSVPQGPHWVFAKRPAHPSPPSCEDHGTDSEREILSIPNDAVRSMPENSPSPRSSDPGPPLSAYASERASWTGRMFTGQGYSAICLAGVQLRGGRVRRRPESMHSPQTIHFIPTLLLLMRETFTRLEIVQGRPLRDLHYRDHFL